MHIIIVGSAYPLRGGIATFVERLAEYLMEIGHRVTIYSYALQYPGFLFPGKTQYSDEPGNDQLQIETKINSINPFNWLRVGKELQALKPDLILVKYWMPFFAPALGTIFRKVRKNKHTRIIAILDNVLPHEQRPGDHMLSRYFLHSLDGAVSMSKSVTDDLRALHESLPCVFAPHPVYDNFGEPVSRTDALERLGLDPEKKYLLFFGFIRKYKGLDLLLEAMADHRIRDTDIRLVVAGEYYTDESYYKELIRKLGIRDQLLLFTDFIPNDEVRYYFSACDVVVQPYRTATQSGISQIAYHFSKPMIVTNVGGLPEIVPHGKVGYVVAPEPGEIASAIGDIMQEGKLDSFRAGIAEEKKKYEWAAFVEKIMAMKNDL